MKKVGIGLGVVIVLILGAVAIAPSFVDWNAYKPEIIAQAQSAIGRPVAIDGPIAVRLLPQPTAAAKGIRLGNLTGGSAPDMARVASIDVRIQLFPLLAGRIEVGSIRIVDPDILLETLADGRRNWEFGTSAEPGAAPGAAPDGGARPAGERPVGERPVGERPAGERAIRALAFDDIRIEGGRLTYRDARAGSVETVEAIDLRLSAGSLAGPFAVKGAAELRGQPIEVDGQTGALGASPAPVRLALALPRAAATVQIEGAATLAPAPKLSGRLVVDAPQPQRLARAFGMTLPLNHGVALGMRVEGDGEAVAFNDLEIKLGDNVINGAARFEAGMPLRGDILLVAGRFDLDGLLAEGGARSPAAPAAAPKGGSAAPAREGAAPTREGGAGEGGFALPGDVVIALDAGIDALVYNREAVRDVKVIARLDDGRITLERASGRLPGDAEVTLAGSVAAVDGAPRFQGRINARADSLRDTVRAFGITLEDVPGERMRRFAWRSGLEADSKGVRLEGIDAGLDASRLKGRAGLTVGPRPSIEAALSIDRVDLDAYLNPEAGAPVPAAPASPQAPAAREGGGEKSGPSPFESLLATEIDLAADLRVERLGYGGIAVRDARVDLGLVPGMLTLRRLAVADLAGARLDARGVVGPRSTDLTLAVTAANMAGLFRLAGIDPPLPPERLGAVSLEANLKGTLADLVVAARLGAVGGTADLKGRAELAGAPGFDLDFTVTHPEVGRLLSVFSPSYRPRAGMLGAGSLAGTAKGGIARFDIGNLRIKAGPASAAGTLTVRLDGPRPHVGIDLAAGEIAIDPFLPAARSAALQPRIRLADASGALTPLAPVQMAPVQMAPVQMAQAAFGRWSAVPIDWSALRGIDASIAFKAEALAYQSLRLVKMDAAAGLVDGVLDLSRLSGGFWGGSLDGRARLDAREMPRVTLDLRIAQARLGEADLMSGEGFGVSEGIADIVAAYGARGASAAALVRSLAGKAEIKVSDGVLSGLNLRAISDRLKRIDQGTDLIALAQAGLSGGATSFRSLTGTFIADGGVIRSDDLKLTADTAAGDGVATIDLPAWNIQSRTQFRLVEHSNAPAVGLRLEGPLDKPRRIIETDALQRYLVQRGVGRLLQRGLGDGQPTQSPNSQPARPGASPQTPEDILRGLLRGLGR